VGIESRKGRVRIGANPAQAGPQAIAEIPAAGRQGGRCGVVLGGVGAEASQYWSHRLSISRLNGFYRGATVTKSRLNDF
jgi:hypothetical protein